MKEYHKIHSIYKRDKDTHKFLLGQYAVPEVEYLANNGWVFDEKIDGTNIRIKYDGNTVEFGGRTDNANIPSFLIKKLQEIFPIQKFKEVFPDQINDEGVAENHKICLYGEGFGARIQKGGGNYIKDGVDFILFDVKIGEFWLQRKDVDEIAEKLEIRRVPLVGYGTLPMAIDIVRNGLKSTFGDFEAEGIVARPKHQLFDRSGRRIIVKIKGVDFK